MKLVKQINVAFISLIVGVFYVVIIGAAWVIHTITKRAMRQSDSYWKIPQLKKLPKHYFSSPY